MLLFEIKTKKEQMKNLWGGGSSDMTGYNAEKINALTDQINSTAASVAETIGNEIQSNVVKPAGETWFAVEAVDYFNVMKTIINNKADTIRSMFSQFRDNVQQTGEAWATNTSSQAPSMGSITQPESIEITVEGVIKEKDDAGNVGVREENVSTVTNGVNTARENIKSHIESLKEQLDSDVAFLGHEQGAAVQQCFGEVINACDDIFKYILGDETGIALRMKDTKEKYATAADSVHDSYSSGDNVQVTDE